LESAAASRFSLPLRSRALSSPIGPYGRVTLHQARAAALKIFAARTEGRDPAAEKQQARRRLVADRIEDVIELFIREHVSNNRSAREISRLLRREVIPHWGRRSIHEIGKRHVIELVTEVAARGTPSAANKLLKVLKTFFTWCIGRAIIDFSQLVADAKTDFGFTPEALNNNMWPRHPHLV
jgi:integrase-like protein/Arm domain-containing DNA-binding protein